MVNRHVIECSHPECDAVLCSDPECGCALEHDEDVADGVIHAGEPEWTVTVHHASPDQPYGLEYDVEAPDEAAAVDAVVDIIGDVNWARVGRVDVEPAA